MRGTYAVTGSATTITAISATLFGKANLWVFEFNNLIPATGEKIAATSNTEIIPEDCSLYIEFTGALLLLQYIVNTSTNIIAYKSADGGWINQINSFTKNTSIALYISHLGNSAVSGTITIRINNSSGRIMSQITWDLYKCYLTTACVVYKNLPDDCSELQAMRKLRDYYSDKPGYSELIMEYYELSPKIISRINLENDPSMMYDKIYDSVKICEGFIAIGDWQNAHDEYLNMYNTLLVKYNIKEL